MLKKNRMFNFEKQRLRNYVFGSITGITLLCASANLTYLDSKDINLSHYTEQQVANMVDQFVQVAKPSMVKKVVVKVVENPEFNAYAYQGDDPTIAFIVVHTGALKLLKNKHELAMVLAHEWSHILLGHTRYWALYEESGIDSEMYTDLMGQQIMRLAGYDPGYGSDVWQHVIEKYGDCGGTTHPLCSHRESYLRVWKTPLNGLIEQWNKLGKEVQKVVDIMYPVAPNVGLEYYENIRVLINGK